MQGKRCLAPRRPALVAVRTRREKGRRTHNIRSIIIITVVTICRSSQDGSLRAWPGEGVAAAFFCGRRLRSSGDTHCIPGFPMWVWILSV